MENYLDKKYVLVNAENFNDLLLFLGKNFLERKVAANLRPVQYVTRNEDGSYTLYYETVMVKYQLNFHLGVEFEEVKPDGDRVAAEIIFEDNKIIHKQKNNNNGKQLTHVYTFYEDKMDITTTGEGLNKIVKRYYVKVK